MRRFLCAVLVCSLPGLVPNFLAPRGRVALRAVVDEWVDDPEPTPKTWRELRRNRRFDHSPGNYWRTQLLPEKESQKPDLVQSNLLRSKTLSRVLYLLQGDFQQWNAVNLATAWHRLAKFLRERNAEKGRREQQDELDLQVLEVQQRLGKAVMALAPEAFDARGISTLIYAWGLTRFKSKLLKPFCISARTRIKEFDPQSIANMVFGIGLLGLKGEPRLLDAVGREMSKRMEEFRMEEVISVVYSLGKLGYAPAGGLCEALGDYVIDRVEVFDPIQLTKIVVSLSGLDFEKRRPMLVLWNHVAREIKSFSTHQLVVLVRTAAKRRVVHEKFTKAVSEEVLARLSELNRDVRLTQIMENLKILQRLVSRKRKAKSSAKTE